MTKSYAILRLLEHGPLLRRELNEITGWNRGTLANTLCALSFDGRIRRFREEGTHETGYLLVTVHSESREFPRIPRFTRKRGMGVSA